MPVVNTRRIRTDMLPISQESTSKSDLDQVLGRESALAPDEVHHSFGAVFARRASSCSSLLTLLWGPRLYSRRLSGRGAVFVSSSKFPTCVFVRVDINLRYFM